MYICMVELCRLIG